MTYEKRVAQWCIGLVFLTTGRVAHAEDRVAALPAVATPVGLPDAPTTEVQDLSRDPAWALYQEATMALIGGDRHRAHALLDTLQAQHADHPAARLAAPARLALREDSPMRAGPDGEPVEQNSRTARAELVSFQTLGGLAAGVELCATVGCETVRTNVVTVAVTTGAGLGLSLWATREGITPGEALAINSATAWGFWQGLALQMATEPEVDNTNFNATRDDRRIPRYLLAGQFAGTIGGIAIATYLQPRAGQVALANSAGVWSGAITLMSLLAADFRDDGRSTMGLLLAASDVGLILGSVAATQIETSRSRMLVIDSSGILGFLLGMGTLAVISPDRVEGRDVATAGLVGTLAGLGVGVWLTRGWDAPELQTRFSPTLQPLPGGAMLSLSGAF